MALRSSPYTCAGTSHPRGMAVAPSAKSSWWHLPASLLESEVSAQAYRRVRDAHRLLAVALACLIGFGVDSVTRDFSLLFGCAVLTLLSDCRDHLLRRQSPVRSELTRTGESSIGPPPELGAGGANPPAPPLGNLRRAKYNGRARGVAFPSWTLRRYRTHDRGYRRSGSARLRGSERSRK